MKLMELVGGLMLLFGGLSTLSTFGLQGEQAVQSIQAVAVGGQVKEQVNLETKTLGREEKDREEYYDYNKEESGKELWEKMKAYYKDYKDVVGGVENEQSN